MRMVYHHFWVVSDVMINAMVNSAMNDVTH